MGVYQNYIIFQVLILVSRPFSSLPAFVPLGRTVLNWGFVLIHIGRNRFRLGGSQDLSDFLYCPVQLLRSRWTSSQINKNPLDVLDALSLE